MQKKIHFFFVLLTIYQQSSTVCGVQMKCAKKLNMETCHLYGVENGIGIRYVKACPESKYCTVSEDNSEIGVCAKKTDLLSAEKKCETSLECNGQRCINGKCKEGTYGDVCESDLNCQRDAFCTDSNWDFPNSCQRMLGEGEVCKTTKNCIVGYECTNGFCLRMGSLVNGAVSDNNKACISGLIGKINAQSICITNRTLTKDCDHRNLCLVTTSYEKYNGSEEILCRETGDGTMKCPTDLEEITLWKRYMKLYNQTYRNIKIDEIKNHGTPRYTLNKKKLVDSYTDYAKYYELMGINKKEYDCIKDYYKSIINIGNFLSLSSYIILYLLIFL